MRVLDEFGEEGPCGLDATNGVPGSRKHDHSSFDCLCLCKACYETVRVAEKTFMRKSSWILCEKTSLPVLAASRADLARFCPHGDLDQLDGVLAEMEKAVQDDGKYRDFR
jgi:hypothetical protein